MLRRRHPWTRTPTALEVYQERLRHELSWVFPTVQSEWASMVDEMRTYSPRVDIAVGPFATRTRYIEDYDRMMDESQGFIESLIVCHYDNLAQIEGERIGAEVSEPMTVQELKYKNRNSRCFLAIEIENRVSRKHLIGGAVNASALGRVGVLIPWSETMLRAAVKLRRYFLFLASVEKNTFDTSNLLIVSKEQMMDSLHRYHGRFHFAP